jgi:hypothetical protein
MFRCRYCGSSHLRSSRVRWKDLVRLMRFQLPVRCGVCHNRDFMGIGRALEVRRQAKERRGARHHQAEAQKPT